ncbi:HAD family hydrolase [Chloroflexota bacterium]
MSKFSVVSVDMFGTLVDLGSVKHNVWREFLKESYTDDLAEEYWNRASELVFQDFEDRVVKERQYISLRVVFEYCYSKLFSEIGLDYNPKAAAQVLAQNHSASESYDDTRKFLEAVGKECKVCLSSDIDEDMLGQLRHLYPFSSVFTSEEIGSYKTSPDGKFFSTVIEHYGVEPGSIIHIGDMLSDIAGAGEAGITTCWLNRNRTKWRHDIKPDFEVNSLIEAASMLGVEIST